MKILGIDPSERHTGLALLEKGRRPIFAEITTGTLCTIEAISLIRTDLSRFWTENIDVEDELCLSVEKQLPVGGQSSALLFYVYMTVLEVAYTVGSGNFHFVSPLPNQLKAYIRDVHGIDAHGHKSSIVQGWQKKYNYQKRISSHRVEAWFLARLARDVLEGRWTYKLPSKEAPLVPWRTTNGLITNASPSSG